MRKFLFVFLLSLINIFVKAALTIDTTASPRHLFKQDEWKNATKDLSYPDANNSLSNNLANSKFYFPSWLSYIIYAIAIAALIFIIYKIIIALNKPRNKKVKNTISVIEDIEEEVADIEYDALLKEALNKNDIRNVIRFSYLISLKILEEHNLIFRSREKTNHDYLNELNDYPYQPLFRNITRIFEYAWYGEIIPDATSYNQFEISFNKLRNTISLDQNK